MGSFKVIEKARFDRQVYRSLKVIETDAIQNLGCGFLFAFHSNYGSICSHFRDIQRQRMA